MATAIRLSSTLIDTAQRYAKVNLRTVPKQIEYWSTLGRIADDNPDLSLSFIKQTLLALEDVKENNISDFEFVRK